MKASVLAKVLVTTILLAGVVVNVGCPATSPTTVPTPANAKGPVASPGKTNGSSEPDAKPTAEPATKPATDEPSSPASAASTNGSEKAVASPPANFDPGKIEVITFDDININMQQDIVYRPWMLTDRAKELDGKRVRINGYMHGGIGKLKGIKEFVLLKNTECKFGPGGQADHLLQVKLQGDATANFAETPLQVDGVLKLNPFQGPDGNTWSVYDLIGDAVRPVRR